MNPAEQSTEPTVKELRHFALVIAIGFIVIFGFFIPWIRSSGWPIWPWILGAVMVAWSYIHAPSLKPLYHLWMKFGAIMHRIMNPLILGLVFFLMFVPIGILMRKISGDPMRRDLDEDADSFRVDSTNPPSEQMEKPF